MTVDVNDMVDVVTEWFEELPELDQREFVATEERDLIRLHHSLGRNIRNHFKLWETTWTPEVVDGVDRSEHHPDAISMYVIRQVWQDQQQ